MEIKIGESLRLGNGDSIICRKGNNSSKDCIKCYFEDLCKHIHPFKGTALSCHNSTRSDNTPVYYECISNRETFKCKPEDVNKILDNLKNSFCEAREQFVLPHTRIFEMGDEVKYNGITKRELFAAMAMQRIVSCGYNEELTAKKSVLYADALIKELNK